MAPICFQFWGANAGRNYEYSGYSRMRGLSMDAIKVTHPEWVEVITWNDFMEGTYLSPIDDPAKYKQANDLASSRCLRRHCISSLHTAEPRSFSPSSSVGTRREYSLQSVKDVPGWTTIQEFINKLLNRYCLRLRGKCFPRYHRESRAGHKEQTPGDEKTWGSEYCESDLSIAAFHAA
jgi:hypothetical protein